MLAGLPGVGLEGSAGHEGEVAVAAPVHHHLPGAGQGRDLVLALSNKYVYIDRIWLGRSAKV